MSTRGMTFGPTYIGPTSVRTGDISHVLVLKKGTLINKNQPRFDIANKVKYEGFKELEGTDCLKEDADKLLVSENIYRCTVNDYTIGYVIGIEGVQAVQAEISLRLTNLINVVDLRKLLIYNINRR